MVIFQLDGVSVTKFLLILILWISLGISIFLYFKYYRSIKATYGNAFFLVFNLILVWNAVNILKSIYIGDGSLFTLFGNVYTGMALLIPFSMVFACDPLNIFRINLFLKRSIKAGLLCTIIFIITSGLDSYDIIQNRLLAILLLPVVYLLPLFFKLKGKTKIFLMLGLLALTYNAVLMSNRTMLVRLILLLGCALVLLLYLKKQNKLFLKLSFLSLFIPFLLLNESIETGTSAIQKYLGQVQNKELKVDSRTFLYIEVFKDLIDNNKLVVGKGANGKYYSEYFRYAKGDAQNRLTVEVGILSLLLKGGLIAVLLNLILLFMAIFYAFFRSNNYYVTAIGFVLLVHTILLFIENITSYSFYNFIIWVCIGLCASKQIRAMSNYEIKLLLNLKKNQFAFKTTS